MLTAFELITFGRRDGNGRRGAIVLAGMLAVFAAFALFSSSSAYGAASSEPAAKKTPMVICRGRLDVVGTARNDTVALRLKAGDKSRLQVDLGGNGSAEFTFKRSAFNRIVVHGASGARVLSIDESRRVHAQ